MEARLKPTIKTARNKERSVVLATSHAWPRLGGGTAPLGRRPCVLEGAEKASFGMRRDGRSIQLYSNTPFDAESST